jgi:hypothetical protein
MFERFTDEARHVMVLAQEEARQLGHDHIGTEHILAGVAGAAEGGPAATVVERYGLTAPEVRSHLVAADTPPTGGIPFTAGAKRTLEAALRESVRLGHDGIAPEHLLLALTQLEDDDGARSVFDAAGADPAAVRRDLLELLAKGAPPRRARFGLRRTGPSPLGRVLPAGRGAPAEGPSCSVCSAPLERSLRYAVLDAEPGQGEERPGARGVVVVYCGACGAALGTATP